MSKSILDQQYYKIIKENPDKKFILYLRTHPNDNSEAEYLSELEGIYGKCSYLPEKRLTIFIITGKKVPDFLDKLNSSNTKLHLSFIQSEDELFESK